MFPAFLQVHRHRPTFLGTVTRKETRVSSSLPWAFSRVYCNFDCWVFTPGVQNNGSALGVKLPSEKMGFFPAFR